MAHSCDFAGFPNQFNQTLQRIVTVASLAAGTLGLDNEYTLLIEAATGQNSQAFTYMLRQRG